MKFHPILIKFLYCSSLGKWWKSCVQDSILLHFWWRSDAI